jgi:hypothetical protein
MAYQERGSGRPLFDGKNYQVWSKRMAAFLRGKGQILWDVTVCRMDLPGPTTPVGTRTDYSVGPWDYPACATRHLKAWSTRTTQE